MSGEHVQALNGFLVRVFNDILKTEEVHATDGFPDLTLRELHLLVEICAAVDAGRDNRASAIAAAQRVTAGTLTQAVSQLERKGYVERVRDRTDKRSVRLYPTERGRDADRRHAAFHQEMIEEVVAELPQEEQLVLLRALDRISKFFQGKYVK